MRCPRAPTHPSAVHHVANRDRDRRPEYSEAKNQHSVLGLWYCTVIRDVHLHLHCLNNPDGAGPSPRLDFDHRSNVYKLIIFS